MAILNKKNKNKSELKKEGLEKKEVPIKEKKEKPFSLKEGLINKIIVRQHVTEKATDRSTNSNVYVFEIEKNANKKDVIRAVKGIYKVVPRKVGIVNIPRKNIKVRGFKGARPGMKKAYVYLKEADRIEII